MNSKMFAIKHYKAFEIFMKRKGIKPNLADLSQTDEFKKAVEAKMKEMSEARRKDMASRRAYSLSTFSVREATPRASAGRVIFDCSGFQI